MTVPGEDDRTRGDHPGGSPRALVVTASASRLSGGLFHSIRRLWHELAARGWQVEVHTLEDRAAEEDRLAWEPLAVRYHRRLGPAQFGFSPGLWRAVSRSSRSADDAGRPVLIDAHGLWMFPDLAAHWAQRRSDAVRIVHPHGMLEPWALRRSRLKKAIAGAAWQTRSLREATALRGSSPQEVESFRRAGYRGTALMIPHGVDMPQRSALAAAVPPTAPGSRNLLFLSRLHPKKGLPTLLRAWSRLARRFPGWQLVVAGPDEHGHEHEVRRLAARLGIEDRCTFVGAVYGAARISLLARAELFVLPSYSENFGLVVAEALAAGVPVVTTTGTPWARVEEIGCGWWVDPEVESLEQALQQALASPSARLGEMGQRGRAWMAVEFSWTAIGSAADQAFRTILPHRGGP